MLNQGMAKAQIVAVLQGYAYDISRLSALLSQGSGSREAQSRLRELKNAVHNDYKHRYSIARSTDLTDLEQETLTRAIREVFFALQGIGVNSTPTAEWRSALFAADIDLQRCLADLSEQKERANAITTDWF